MKLTLDAINPETINLNICKLFFLKNRKYPDIFFSNLINLKKQIYDKAIL